MTLALQAAPLLLLLALLASGRMGPLAACGIALLAALPAIAVTMPESATLIGILLHESPRAAFLAFQPIAVVSGGLLFHTAVVRSQGMAAPRAPTPARIFAVALPLGAFLESVTGFAVGAVFALSALHGMRIGGAVAVALAMQALVLVPWGGLGPGSALGAVLAGVPAQDMVALVAWPNAAWLLTLAPVLWWLQAKAGYPAPPREKAMQALILVTLAVLLVALHRILPFETVGVVASGIVAVWALWRADRPRDLATALRASWPYLLVTVCLLAARLVPNPPAFRPFPELPGFPITHVAVVLWIVALGLLAAQPQGLARVSTALHRALRPAAAMMLYVLLGRWLAGGGVAQALAQSLIESTGDFAAYALVPIGFLAGFITGSNVGGNAALMPVQVALGAQLGLPQLLAPALHNFTSGAGAGMSIAGTAMLCALLADRTRPGQVWRVMLPSMALVMLVGTLTLIFLR
ncbi:L-lactate permease [Roseococcus pinisoli]|uniref:L-lactate permease n=1 Tax=Roseococcus pinisoli TaxID=2835040 RepID=A0ABS5QCK6_9PROT|nr:L-lactate permease [Roseococcus pinisoli]MBS7810682.1 L-lactate permease [Roseococcus pinisoli]